MRQLEEKLLNRIISLAHSVRKERINLEVEKQLAEMLKKAYHKNVSAEVLEELESSLIENIEDFYKIRQNQ